MAIYDVARSQAEAKKDLEGIGSENYKDLLKKYSDQMAEILKEFEGQESNIPLHHEYYLLRNKYQIVNDKFTKE